jgi:hypothetical protein
MVCEKKSFSFARENLNTHSGGARELRGEELKNVDRKFICSSSVEEKEKSCKLFSVI